MPVVTVDPDELRSLAGAEDVSDDDLIEELFGLGLEFEGWTDDGDFDLEFAPDRLDRLSVEGIARSLRYQYGHDRGVRRPTVNPSQWTITVEESVPTERSYVSGAIVRNLELDQSSLASLIQLQEKLHETMGRRRKKGAIGLHDLTMLQGRRGDQRDDAAEIIYRGIEPTADSFVPLESETEMTPQDVLNNHPTGQSYADVVTDYEHLPAIYDELGLFSFPPIINSRRTEVTTESRDLLIELTGTDQWTIDKMLSIICYALDMRGGIIEEIEVAYPEQTLERPDFDPVEKSVPHAQIERTMGINVDRETVLDLLERSGLSGTPHETEDGLHYQVEIPPYRVDVLHPVDIIDDIGRAYGFNNLEPRYPDEGTIGGRHDNSRFERLVRGLLVGVGFEDLLNFHLISRRANFDRMNLSPESDGYGANRPPSIMEPYSEEYEIVRTWGLPSAMMVLENNTHRAYPQQLAEIGLRAGIDRTQSTKVEEQRTVVGVIANHDASYEHAKAKLDSICRRLGVTVNTPAREHPSFIDGRSAEIDVGNGPTGVIGEVHPDVLVSHGLEVPVAAFEVPLDELREAHKANT